MVQHIYYIVCNLIVYLKVKWLNEIKLSHRYN